MENKGNNTDWKLLMQFFPEGWEDKAKELGAIARLRKFKRASDVLRLLLIHLLLLLPSLGLLLQRLVL